MATRALAAPTATNQPELVEDDETYVSSAQTAPVRASLPAVDDGSGATVAVGYEIRFEATGGSPIMVETADGRRVGTVPGRGQAVLVAEAGAQESEADFWRFMLLAAPPSAAIADANGTNNEVEVNLIRNALVAHGILKAE